MYHDLHIQSLIYFHIYPFYKFLNGEFVTLVFYIQLEHIIFVFERLHLNEIITCVERQ